MTLDAGRASAEMPGHASDDGERPARPLALVDRALQQARIEREAIECLIVGLGPGSYTGIRSAIALAQGWQLARPVVLLGVSSADALASGTHAQGWLGCVGVVIDAQRGEFYFAGYEISKTGWRLKEPLRIARKEETPALAAAYPTIAGPEATRFFKEARIVYPDARLLGALAKGRADFTTGEKLEPIYLRATTFVKAPPPRILL